MEHFTKEWLVNERILCYRFKDTGKAAADAWYEDVGAVFRDWSIERPLHLMLDVRMQGRIISSQALTRARQVSHVRPDIPGRTAVLIASTLAAQVISAVIRSGLASGGRERMVFNHEASAIAWLLQNDKSETAEMYKVSKS